MFTVKDFEDLLEIVEQHQDRYCRERLPRLANVDDRFRKPEHCEQVENLRRKVSGARKKLVAKGASCEKRA